MIETFKIVTGIYDTVVSPTMLAAGSSYATRGHDFRLQTTARYDRDLRIGNIRSNRISIRIGGYNSNSNRISNRIRR